ncbi:MAG: MarR family transcriptional regulator [Candidatus Geothermincolales bacterium]
MREFYRIAGCRHAVFREYLPKYGLTFQQFHLLLHLKKEGPLKISDLSQRMLVSMPTTSRMANHLMRQGLVKKSKGSSDRRSTYLELTSRGEEIVMTVESLQARAISSILQELSNEEAETFIRVIRHFADSLTGRLGMFSQGKVLCRDDEGGDGR